MKSKLIILNILLLGVGINIAGVSAEELHVAVAANFIKPIKSIKSLFEKESGHHVIVSTGSTGQLYAQIKNGAPSEVFLAADRKRPKQLINEGLAVNGSLFTYAVGQLVLWSSQADRVDQTGQVLNHDKFKHLAIANPQTAPYGAAAKQVLEKRGLWESLQNKIVQGNNITQTYQLIATGNAELGFIALSQYKAIVEKSSGSHWLVDQTLYDPIQQGAVLLKEGENQLAAQAFIEFLQSPPARRIIEEFGYVVPKEQ